jgi:uncharacterized protein YcbK (DUF882 family)
MKTYITDNFFQEEFACKCPYDCDMKDGSEMSKDFVGDLQVVREVINRPIVVRSGLRCTEWNASEGGAPDSAHTKGVGVDIACNTSKERHELIGALKGLFCRIGIGKTFIHVDIDDSKAQDVMWVY